MSTLITPRTMSGFRDYLPSLMLAREEVLRRAREVYRSYGFTPIDTPACESLDVLLGKGGDESDKLVYRVKSARGEGDAEMGLRFDLTVPFARFSAQYINDLGTPFKRYAMGPVWRGERPGKGRYREFWQCDFDTIGTTSNAADIETALVINDLFAAIGFERFEIRINNRMVLNGLLEVLGVRERAVEILRVLDKLPKVGEQAVFDEMTLLNRAQAEAMWEAIQQKRDEIAAQQDSVPGIWGERENRIWDQTVLPLLDGWERSGVKTYLREAVNRASCGQGDPPLDLRNPAESRRQEEQARREAFIRQTTGIEPATARRVLELATTKGTNAEILDRLDAFFAPSPNERAAEGIARLRELLAVAKTAGIPEGRIKIDLSICRGLDYYTGTIYETFLSDLPGIGSVCSGGRYDNLASKYTKQVLPGVGASLGLDRLVAAMEELKHPLLTGQTTPAQVLVVNFDATRLGDYQRIARTLRAAGVYVEVFPNAAKKNQIGPQLSYAEKRGFKLAVIAGPAEFEQGVWKVKNLAKREETALPEASLTSAIQSALR